MKNNGFTQVFEINGIKYIVNSVFENSNNAPNLEACISKVFENEYLNLTNEKMRVTMTDESAYSTVKEGGK